jgi:hypothetical protein
MRKKVAFFNVLNALYQSFLGTLFKRSHVFKEEREYIIAHIILLDHKCRIELTNGIQTKKSMDLIK